MKKSPITRIELVTFRLAFQMHIHWTMVSIDLVWVTRLYTAELVIYISNQINKK